MIELQVTFNSELPGHFIEDLTKMLEEFPDIKMEEVYDSKFSDTKKKGYKIKGKFGARLDPFVGVFVDNIPVKGFYSEVSECNIDNIKTYLNEITIQLSSHIGTNREENTLSQD